MASFKLKIKMKLNALNREVFHLENAARHNLVVNDEYEKKTLVLNAQIRTLEELLKVAA